MTGEAEAQLRDRVARLEQRVSMLTAILRLVLALLRVSGFKLDLVRIPDAQGKRLLLSAVEREREIMPLAAALRVIGLSAARYHDWVLQNVRQRSCAAVETFGRRSTDDRLGPFARRPNPTNQERRQQQRFRRPSISSTSRRGRD
jgi:hypothetical protein